MGGQTCFIHGRAMGIRGCWMKIRRGVQRKRRHVCGFWWAFVVDRVESRDYKIE